MQEPVLDNIRGEPVYFFPRLGSTMDMAQIFAARGDEGIIVAACQDSGMGRYGRQWVSFPGGLYLSWVLRAQPVLTSFLSELISISLVETFRAFKINCNIKPPNDIITGGKKIAGILLVKKDNFYIAGIGINTKNDVNHVPHAVSMRQLTVMPFENRDVLDIFIKTFHAFKKEFGADGEMFLQKWSKQLIK